MSKIMDEVQPKRQTLGLKQVPSYIQKLQELKNQVEPKERIQGHRKPSQDADNSQNKTAQSDHVPYYKREQVVKALQWLQKTFPLCFVEGQHRPLKININQDVFAYL
ncbi:MAG: ProQ/FINO family protein, partial [Alphaproteobacteria bacterium]|nr:ProQ/FINO family protein [Alphaproteobacteria bacterium]